VVLSTSVGKWRGYLFKENTNYQYGSMLHKFIPSPKAGVASRERTPKIQDKYKKAIILILNSRYSDCFLDLRLYEYINWINMDLVVFISVV